jgi:hypothetical protein
MSLHRIDLCILLLYIIRLSKTSSELYNVDFVIFYQVHGYCYVHAYVQIGMWYSQIWIQYIYIYGIFILLMSEVIGIFIMVIPKVGKANLKVNNAEALQIINDKSTALEFSVTSSKM